MTWIAGIIAAFTAYAAFESAQASVLCGLGASFAVVIWQGLREVRDAQTAQSRCLLGDLEKQARVIHAMELRIRSLETREGVAIPEPAPVELAKAQAPTSEVSWQALRVPEPEGLPKAAEEAPPERWADLSKQAPNEVVLKPAGTEPVPAAADIAPIPNADSSVSASNVPAQSPFPVQPPLPAEEPWEVFPPDPITQVWNAARDWLFGGNTVARVGVLVLVVGVALLVKYAADHDYFPLELRLALAALIGVALAVIGFRTREKRRDFSLVLQGGGIAATYLVVFFAYRSYGLLPASLTFSMLVVLGTTHVILAVVQNAESLALMGMLGGFLAPVLASKGGGSHISLFSYYALLNAGIFAIAWFRPFRFLNLLGFTCTFGIGTAWGALRYQPEHVQSAGFFLALYFVYYSLTSVLFTWRQPTSKRGLIDSTLTFGTPLATFSLMLGLLRPYHYGIALGTVAMGGYYVILARFLWKRAPELLRAQVEAFIAIGIGFISLAIPFALDDHHVTGMAWAMESTGLFWVGARQQRLRARVAAYLLLILSMIAIASASDTHTSLHDNSALLSHVVLALAAWTMSILTYQYATSLHRVERAIVAKTWAVGLVAWLLALDASLERYVPDAQQRAVSLALLSATAVCLELASRRFSWQPGRWLAFALTPALFLWLAFGNVDQHPFERGAWLSFAMALCVSLWVGHRADHEPRTAEGASPSQASNATLYYATWVWIVAILVVWEAHFAISRVVPTPAAWMQATCLVTGIAYAWLMHAYIGRGRWPFTGDATPHRLTAILPIAVLAFGYGLLLTLSADGSIAPLLFVPIVNPIDLSSALAGLFCVRLALSHWQSGLPSGFKRWFGFVVFVWLTAALVRTLCNWKHVPYEPDAVLASSLIQSALSIFWAILGLVAMVVASRRNARTVWMAGALLLAVVVAKLFFSDLSTLSNGIKIVTFLAVGALLIVIGYVAPVPPANPEANTV